MKHIRKTGKTKVVLLAALLTLSLSACGNGGTNVSLNTDNAAAEQAETTEITEGASDAQESSGAQEDSGTQDAPQTSGSGTQDALEKEGSGHYRKKPGYPSHRPSQSRSSDGSAGGDGSGKPHRESEEAGDPDAHKPGSG